MYWPAAILLSLTIISSQGGAIAQSSGKENVHLARGNELLRLGKGGDALKEFELALKDEPKSKSAYNNIGRIYAERNDPARAIANFKKALDIDPLYEPALSNLGLILYSTGKAEDAILPWRLCLQGADKDDPTMHYYLANALRDMSNKGDAKEKESYAREAREHYETAIKLNPKFAAAYSGLSVIDLDEGKLNEALERVSKSIALRPDSSFSYYHLGLIEERLGHKDRAIKAFENSLKYEKVNKYSDETKNRIARLKGGKIAESVNSGQGSGSAGSPNPHPGEELGENQGGGTGKNQPQSQSQSQSVAAGQIELLKSKSYQALARHAWLDASRGFDYLVKHGSGSDPVILNNLGLALAEQGQYARAVESYRKAYELRPGFMEAQYNLGMALRKQGDIGGAEQAFRKSIEDAAKQKKVNPDAQNMLGILLRERGEDKGAYDAFRKAILQSGGDLPVAHYNLGVLLEHMERSREAVPEYRTYLRLSPRGKNADAARERLKRLTGGA